MEPQRNSASGLRSPSCRACLSAPFTTRLLEYDNSCSGASPPPDHTLPSLLPASYRTKLDDLAAASDDVDACVANELNLQRLNRVYPWLWIAGRPMPPRPLHHQLLLSREIVITERMDIHLVWTGGHIYIKPMPRFLLEPHFWYRHLSCRCSGNGGKHTGDLCAPEKLRKCAIGFLFSFAALITHESDFFIAKEKHLLPEGVTWHAWRSFVRELDTEHIYRKIDQRFFYGELRLSRLNKIYFFMQTPLRSYMTRWQQYSGFLQHNLAGIGSAIIYITIVLTAMQVGLATNTLRDSNMFQSVSYGFTIFSILGPPVALGLLLVVFCYVFLNNWATVVAYKAKRQQHMASAG
ncbi:hypothetical protein jhhlp_002161 [Lomentospora prolificans]|uniref:Uncharacterized protein n=1 Tax=Lomentospora prolificans TaxID=41688 RepID=A0A2N3ND88_9PEZI|nr:hypothetical protein jhhlp_002161 [Lomentospora prolificans]